MSQGCTDCGDTYSERKLTRAIAEQSAQNKAIETKKAYAVCEDAGSFFIYEAGEAIRNNFLVRGVFSGLPY